MAAYHDPTHCAFDIWSPTPDRWGHNRVENLAFSAYCKHIQECDDIVDAILEGQTDFTLDDFFTQGDLDYINAKLRAAGIEAELTLD